MMPDLTEFLLARITEDESKARHAAHLYGRPPGIPGGATYHELAYPRGHLPVVAYAHASRWEPARVLAECEARRKIIELHALSGDSCSTCGDGHDGYGDLYQRYPCETLRALALPYANRPGWREDWKL